MKYCLLKIHSPTIIPILQYFLLVKLIEILKYMKNEELETHVQISKQTKRILEMALKYSRKPCFKSDFDKFCVSRIERRYFKDTSKIIVNDKAP